jgi:hypothetical protein
MTVAQDQPMDFRDYMAREQQQAVMREQVHRLFPNWRWSWLGQIASLIPIRARGLYHPAGGPAGGVVPSWMSGSGGGGVGSVPVYGRSEEW